MEWDYPRLFLFLLVVWIKNKITKGGETYSLCARRTKEMQHRGYLGFSSAAASGLSGSLPQDHLFLGCFAFLASAWGLDPLIWLSSSRNRDDEEEIRFRSVTYDPFTTTVCTIVTLNIATYP
jgi:hypothetical protein